VVLCDGKTNSVGNTLTKRTSGNFDTIGIVGFWVTRGMTIYRLNWNTLAKAGVSSHRATNSESFDIIHRQLVAIKVEKSILEHACMSVTVIFGQLALRFQAPIQNVLDNKAEVTIESCHS
jgi:hypothetical protein